MKEQKIKSARANN